MSDTQEHLFQCSDVVALHLLEPRPAPPHVEDWLTDFVYQRPRLLRRLEGEKRADFFPRYLDRAPEDVVIYCKRSLCLVKPSNLCAHLELDAYSGKYQARMSFVLKRDGQRGQATIDIWRTDKAGIPVTDLKWHALGKSWLGKDGGRLTVGNDDLYARLEAKTIYLSLGLSRIWRGKCWPLVVGVHVVPDYQVLTDLVQEL
jgi:hypothetical protein